MDRDKLLGCLRAAKAAAEEKERLTESPYYAQFYLGTAALANTFIEDIERGDYDDAYGSWPDS